MPTVEVTNEAPKHECEKPACLEKPKDQSYKWVLLAIVALQVAALAYIWLVPDVTVCLWGKVEESKPMIVKKVVLIDQFSREMWTFDNVAVKKDEGFINGGYWIYGDKNETVYIPNSCFYLENPTDATLKQFDKRPQGDNDERK